MTDIDAAGVAAIRNDTLSHSRGAKPFCQSCVENVILLADALDEAQVRITELEDKCQRIQDERANLHNESVRHLRQGEAVVARVEADRDTWKYAHSLLVHMLKDRDARVVELVAECERAERNRVDWMNEAHVNLDAQVRAEERIGAALGLHDPEDFGFEWEVCGGCGDRYPCATVRALDGECQ